jgi:3' terminal RNA ribose 2'-O-methyltransferase Hen1
MQRHPLDPEHPEWEPSPLFSVELRATRRLKELLAHLYVLIPVLDDEKHYWVGSDEVEKLLRHGEEWLGAHPEREFISRRYLKHQRSLVRQALARLGDDDAPETDDALPAATPQEESLEQTLSLNDQRLGAVLAALKAEGARAVLDLGCGEGKLLRLLLDDRAFERIVGIDVSHRALEIAEARLHLDRMSPTRRARIELLHGSLLYRDKRLHGFDAAAVVEVIEHLDLGRLAAFTRILFEHTRPKAVVLTTPNAEYNARFPDLPAGKLRHVDHRFEWTRAEFEAWACGIAERHGYAVRFLPVGAADPALGAPTQMAIFRQREAT